MRNPYRETNLLERMHPEQIERVRKRERKSERVEEIKSEKEKA